MLMGQRPLTKSRIKKAAAMVICRRSRLELFTAHFFSRSMGRHSTETAGARIPLIGDSARSLVKFFISWGSGQAFSRIANNRVPASCTLGIFLPDRGRLLAPPR